MVKIREKDLKHTTTYLAFRDSIKKFDIKTLSDMIYNGNYNEEQEDIINKIIQEKTN